MSQNRQPAGEGPAPIVEDPVRAAPVMTPATPITMPYYFGAPWLPIYTGIAHSTETSILGDFKMKMQSLFRLYPLKEQQKVEILMGQLKGLALREVTSWPTEEKKTVDQILNRLATTFDTRTVSELKMHFFARKQQPGESLRGYALSLQEALRDVQQADPEEVHDKEKMLLDQFTEGARGEFVKTQLRLLRLQKPGSTFLDFKEAAIEVLGSSLTSGAVPQESIPEMPRYQENSDAQESSFKGATYPPTVKGVTVPCSKTCISDSSSELRGQLAELTRGVTEMRRDLQILKRQQALLHEEMEWCQERRPLNSSQWDVHRNREILFSNHFASQRRPIFQSCEGSGQIKREFEQPDHLNSKFMWSTRYVSQCPVVQVCINGVSMPALLDTGSQVTTIQATQFEQHWTEEQMFPSTSTLINPIASNGHCIPCKGYWEAEIQIGRTVLPQQGFIITTVQDDGLPPVIVGMNVLRNCCEELVAALQGEFQTDKLQEKQGLQPGIAKQKGRMITELSVREEHEKNKASQTMIEMPISSVQIIRKNASMLGMNNIASSSRNCEQPIQGTSFDHLQDKSQMIRHLKALLKTGKYLTKRQRQESSPELLKLLRQRERLFEKKGQLVRCSVDPNTHYRISQLVIPRQSACYVLEEYHDKSGHPGCKRMETSIWKKFFWVEMREDIKRWCRNCPTCSVRRTLLPLSLQNPLSQTSCETESQDGIEEAHKMYLQQTKVVCHRQGGKKTRACKTENHHSQLQFCTACPKDSLERVQYSSMAGGLRFPRQTFQDHILSRFQPIAPGACVNVL
ncbi:uncharacterized protein LOC134917549 [Pseudophryne corroboree]|uniref:uncharacterized protein LOC134917549 n=1 Tax=Pseudophryne corroboree TaxID=495146 RepID=UPI0030818C94